LPPVKIGAVVLDEEPDVTHGLPRSESGDDYSQRNQRK
jgi:hypothetical protein